MNQESSTDFRNKFEEAVLELEDANKKIKYLENVNVIN